MNNLFLFTGAETFLINEQVQSWKKAFLEKHGDINLIHLDGAQIEMGELTTQMEALPFLGEKRLIFIDHLPPTAKAAKKGKTSKKDDKEEKRNEQLLAALENIPETSVVVFIQPNPDKRKKLYKKFVQIAQVKTFDSLEGYDLNQWIQKQAHGYWAILDNRAIQHLISLVGHDLWRLDQELKKLGLYAGGQPVTIEMINELVTPHLEANVFHFTDALSARNAKKAMSHLHRSVEAGDSLNQLFYMVIRQFRLFLQVSGHLQNFPSASPGSIASTLKIHPFVAKNIVRQIKSFNRAELKSAYWQLLKIDEALKTSKIRITVDDHRELTLAIERFILEFCS